MIQGAFHWIDNEIVDDYARLMGPHALAIYVFLCRFSNNKTSRCHRVSHAVIAQTVRVSISTVRRKLRVLESQGLIRVYQPNTYEAYDFELLQVAKHAQRARE